MNDMAAVDRLRAPVPAIDLAAAHEFEQIQLRGISLSIDRDSRERLDAMAALSGPGVVNALPALIAMLDQDRTTAASGDLASRFAS